jgi:altronate dehydratase
VNPLIVISDRDNVATALEPLEAGRVVGTGGVRIAVRDAIPRGHKIALAEIRAGAAIIKYGSPIGTATRDIPQGGHVHTHNLSSGRGRGDLSAHVGAGDGRIAEPLDDGATP